ncbi:TonB family protein [Rubrolithibacter danxiaensis]|uniref:TonB family protein n=1 Tax=Rubrolithibacter danxiaensis TaxID=3390805 RepID=UPI003BF776B9
MNGLTYLFQANLYLAVFYLFYAALLRNETFFRMNRYYLVGSASISLLIPALQSEWVRSLFVSEQVYHAAQTINTVIVTHTGTSPNDSTGFTTWKAISIIYVVITLVLSAKFAWQLLTIKRFVNDSKEIKAFSFFSLVKVDEDLNKRETISKHEMVHVREWHSADVLFFEILAIINWFNPVIYAYRKAIKNIHEYIADETAAANEESKSDYALLLLSNTFGLNPHQLTNNFFNQSLLKKRIYMLNKTKSKRAAVLKYGLSAPLFAVMVIFSSASLSEPINLTKISSIYPTSITQSNYSKDDSNFKELKDFFKNQIRYPEEARKNKIQGTTIVSFRVSEYKKIDETEIIRELGGGLDREAEEMLKRFDADIDAEPGVYTLAVKFELAGLPKDNYKIDESKLENYAGEIVVVAYAAEEKPLKSSQKEEFSPSSDSDSTHNFAAVEVTPEFPGGQEGWSEYLSKNLRYPKEAREKNIEGRVTVQFIVRENGNLSDIKVLRGIGSGCDEEAVRVLENSPTWNPGINNGIKVKVSYVMPIVFQIDKKAVAPVPPPPPIIKTVKALPPPPPPPVPVKAMFILDGKEIKYEDFQKIPTDEIKEVLVWKEKEAIERYGEKGKNGVVVVATKTAQNNK